MILVTYGNGSFIINIDIKQKFQVTYLGCILDETTSREPMAYKIIKISSRLNYLFRKKYFLTPRLRQLLCNAMIQLNFDYAYPNLAKKLINKIHSTQNKFDKMTYISQN